MHKNIITALAGLVIILSACQQKPEFNKEEMDAFKKEAKAASMQLGKTLKGELMTAMSEGGPEQAIEVCHKRAPEIATAISKEKGITIGRVSLKNRNPNNAPNAWQTKVLEDFLRRKEAGESPKELVHLGGYADKKTVEYRFMKAIPTQSLCLSCHGKNIDPELKKKINSLYPEDKAIGFEEGDIRGAFVVTKKVK